METFEEILTEIEDSGYKLNNLFQRSDGYWMANVRSAHIFFFEYGIRPTVVAAMEAALQNARSRLGTIKHGLGGVRDPSGKFLHQIGEKIPDAENYKPGMYADKSAGDLLGSDDDDDLLGTADTPLAETLVDDLLG